MLISVPAHIFPVLASDLEGEFASQVRSASFRDGEEGEFHIDFFRLWGRTIRREYNRRTTMTAYQFVEGEDLEMFNLIYGAGA